MATLQFSSNQPQRGSYIVYVAGQFCPTLSVTVSSGVWQFPTINIEVAPDRELIRLGKADRVPVQVFYLDNAYTQATGKPPDFRLLAEGEIVGWQYQNTSNGRSMVFQAVDYFSIFTQLFPYLMTNYGDLLQGSIEPPASLVPMPISEFTFPAALFYQGLDNSSGKFITRPFDFISNLLNALCGVSCYEQYKSSVTVNFFSRWIRKNNFLNRIAPSPVLEAELSQYPGSLFPLMQVVQSDEALKQFMPALAQQGDRIANSSNMWELLHNIFQKVYYEIGLNPAPAIVTTSLSGVVQGPPQFANGGSTTAGTPGSGPASPTNPVRLMNYVTKPALQFCVPPSCNVLYPSMIKSFAYGENYQQQPTRAYINDEMISSLILSDASGSAGFSALNATTVAAPARAQQEIAALINQPNMIRSGKNFLIWPTEYFLGPVVAREATPSWFMYLAQATSQSNTPANNNIIYQLYADSELLRMQAQAKSGAVVTIFDPYVCAGHPGVVFDNLEVGNHVFAYFTTVTHTLSPSEFSTQIGYTYAQTFSDFFDAYANDIGLFTNFSAGYNFNAQQVDVETAEQKLTDAQEKLAADTKVNAAESVIAADNVAINTANYQLTQANLTVAQQALDEANATLTGVQQSSSATITADQAAVAAAQAQLRADQAANASEDVITADQQAVSAAQEQLATDSADLNAAQTAANNAQSVVTPLQTQVNTLQGFQAGTLDASPASPIPIIRETFQNIGNASQYYSELFFQAQLPANRVSVFSWRDALGVYNPDSPQTPDDIYFDVTAPLPGQTQAAAVESNATSQDGQPDFQLKPLYAQLAAHSTSALIAGSRPICTLDQYIDFIGPKGVRIDPVAATSSSGLGAVYYNQILNYSVASATPPVEYPATSGNISQPVDADLSQDWGTAIMNYRNKVLGKVPVGG
jgi:hypothetical protein